MLTVLQFLPQTPDHEDWRCTCVVGLLPSHHGASTAHGERRSLPSGVPPQPRLAQPSVGCSACSLLLVCTWVLG